MTEPEIAKHQATVEASSPAADAADDSVETPMLAVWLSLAAILVAGLYGLYLGTSAKSKPKPDSTATSAIVPAGPIMALHASPISDGRRQQS